MPVTTSSKKDHFLRGPALTMLLKFHLAGKCLAALLVGTPAKEDPRGLGGDQINMATTAAQNLPTGFPRALQKEQLLNEGPTSFISKCDDRINPRRAASRHVTRQHGNPRQQQRDAGKSREVGGTHAV